MTTYPNFDASKSYIGECQVCGAMQVVNDGHLVLHGYKRPGDGQIFGECWGQRHVPFELSCEVAKDFLKHLVEVTLPAASIKLAKLDDPQLQDLTVSISDGYYPRNRGWARETKYKIINIGPGYVHVRGADNDYDGNTTFEAFRKRAVGAQKRFIVQTIKNRDALIQKIANWKYAPEKLQTREEISAAKKAAGLEKMAWSKYYRNQKNLWKYVADAIRDHKAGYSWKSPERERFMAANPFPTDKERAAARKK